MFTLWTTNAINFAILYFSLHRKSDLECLFWLYLSKYGPCSQKDKFTLNSGQAITWEFVSGNWGTFLRGRRRFVKTQETGNLYVNFK